ncbi:hypothetical protein QUA20_21315 [Microcoleus sp. Pol7_A1]|uniref:hypothetical protein n=1 Tax=Microcoleus sp. Pol7_A1 TaxID=2818893 RepID=UPI002FD4F95B
MARRGAIVNLNTRNYDRTLERRNLVFLQKTIFQTSAPVEKPGLLSLVRSRKYNLLLYNFAHHLPGDINSPALKQIPALTIPANQT